MKTNTCDTCGLPIMRVRRGERPDKWIDLQPEPLGVNPARGRLRRGARYLDGKTAFFPDDMTARIRGTGDRLADFPVHLEHQCGGR
jgi:hypothetical protein